MKKLTLLLALSFIFTGFNDPGASISDKERKAAIKEFKQGRQDLHSTVENLNKAQLDFKSDSTRWSVYDCVKHITLAEAGLWEMVIEALKKPSDPAKRVDIKVTDEALSKMVADRTQKATAPDDFKPEKATYSSLAQTLQAFDAQTEEIINYVRTTKDDLRNHYVQMPNGTIDVYQMLLVIAAHNQRHLAQIREVMSNVSYPKS